jgi:hypothetical protein
MQATWSAKIFGDREDPRKRLQALFGGEMPAGGQPPRASLDWAVAELQRTEMSAGRDVVAATRYLRRAEPRLTLRAATFLATHAIERGASGSRVG